MKARSVELQAREIARKLTGGGKNYQYAVSAARDLILEGRNFTERDVLQGAADRRLQQINAVASQLGRLVAGDRQELRPFVAEAVRYFVERTGAIPDDGELLERAIELQEQAA